MINPWSVPTSIPGGKRTSARGWWFTYDESGIPPTKYGGCLVAEYRSKAVIAENLATGKVQRFKSAKEASEDTSVHRSSISLIVNGKKLSAKGYTFRRAHGA